MISQNSSALHLHSNTTTIFLRIDTTTDIRTHKRYDLQKIQYLDTIFSKDSIVKDTVVKRYDGAGVVLSVGVPAGNEMIISSASR